MSEIIILIICILLIAICFLAISKTKKKDNETNVQIIPDAVQNAFRDFADNLLASEGILLEEAKITSWELLEQVSYEQGVFKYYRIEYNLIPESPVETKQGLILNSKEIFEKFGIKDEIIILFYKENDEIFEISFMLEKRLNMQGYKAYIEKKYKNVEEFKLLEEYSLYIDETPLTLWENIAENSLVEELMAVRFRAEGNQVSLAQYIDKYENEDIEIQSLIQFERKKEPIYYLRAKTQNVQTNRGIHVGNTIQELKEKYPSDLCFREDLNGEGPAYGYIPQDGTDRYIAFKTRDQLVSEIIITASFGERPFFKNDGYIDQDITWIEDDYKNKLTEKYARAIYLGQHKIDLDPRQAFNLFVTNNFKSISILQKGLWKEYDEEKELIYFVIGEDPKDKSKIYIEVKLKQIMINTFTKDTAIWVVSHHRSQKKRG